ncbi:hypothetical protein [Pseudonocardia sp.]|uniref:hypothetical protein n=1 Tax=Pseudonocardia sp. TaxID=60912 RepID=UPI002619563E|nr:hypothetical protein [Pseudonocardia sp.]
MKTASHTGPAHSAAGDRPGWGPTPRSRRSYVGRRDGRVMTALRGLAYVLTSLASAVFLALVVYGTVQFAQLRDAFAVLTP